ncbi:hypothetical protein [Methanimicrococcus blatticola]|uniref:hypothetical protein n=1 Tax=Methanimicrococcus blatticola TaxID=91560 RepID=UPI00105D8761|nr:hypothetical protein [Methanimicrococcus blatticola]MBZ3936307.1 hypothetical protein [Methanimicrococcus blatticola]MCC2508310.1 hypothetical protein [Methanimicrococcus blatticola]
MLRASALSYHIRSLARTGHEYLPFKLSALLFKLSVIVARLRCSLFTVARAAACANPAVFKKYQVRDPVFYICKFSKNFIRFSAAFICIVFY